MHNTNSAIVTTTRTKSNPLSSLPSWTESASNSMHTVVKENRICPSKVVRPATHVSNFRLQEWQHWTTSPNQLQVSSHVISNFSRRQHPRLRSAIGRQKRLIGQDLLKFSIQQIAISSPSITVSVLRSSRPCPCVRMTGKRSSAQCSSKQTSWMAVNVSEILQ